MLWSFSIVGSVGAMFSPLQCKLQIEVRIALQRFAGPSATAKSLRCDRVQDRKEAALA